jgi:hypothetical protein
VHNLKEAGFQCVSDIFILVNELNEKIEVYSRPEAPDKKGSSISNPMMGSGNRNFRDNHLGGNSMQNNYNNYNYQNKQNMQPKKPAKLKFKLNVDP